MARRRRSLGGSRTTCGADGNALFRPRGRSGRKQQSDFAHGHAPWIRAPRGHSQVPPGLGRAPPGRPTTATRARGLRPSARCGCPVRSLDPTRGLTAGVRCKGHERPRAGFGLPARTQGSGREPHRAKPGECEVTASFSHVRARKRLGEGRRCAGPHSSPRRFRPKVGDGSPTVWATGAGRVEGVATTTLVLVGGRQEHVDSEQIPLQPHGVDVGEPLPGGHALRVIPWHLIQEVRRESESGETWEN